MLELVVALSMSVVTSYHIGNSYTNDMQPEGVAALSGSRGIEHQAGFHIRASWSLESILANPDEVSIDPNEFGTFAQALPNNPWDIVTLQPHPTGGTTLGKDVESIKTIINLTRSNPANADTNFYIYQGWPQISSSYQSAWLTPSANELDTPMTRGREYYNNLIERVRAETDANVYMIPSGEVLYEFDVRARAGKIPGYTSVNSLYRDALHMSYLAGRYAVGVTTFSTIMGQYPTGPEIPTAENYGSDGGLTPAQQTALLETIRDVLDKSPYSGVSMPPPLLADFDDNLVVNDNDLQLLQQSLNKEALYDIDIDGDVDGRDFLIWQRRFTLEPVHPDFSLVDLNKDGAFDANDLPVWQNAYGNSANADLDGDGDSDGRDFLVWQRALSFDPSDLNLDFLTDGFELALWKESLGYNIDLDANGDGKVDNTDLEIWQNENGRIWTYPAAVSAPPLPSQMRATLADMSVVPEPTTAILVACGVILSLGRRIRR